MTARGETAGPPQLGGVLVPTALLATIGIVMVYSATAPFALGQLISTHFVRQVVGLAVGLVLAAIASRLTTEHWRRLAFPLWGVAVLLLLLVPFFGDKVNGSRRWLTVPGFGFQFQPSEFARWASLIAVTVVLATREQVVRRGLAPTMWCFAIAALPAGLIFIEPDTGSAAVLMGLVIVLLFVAGTPLPLFVVPGGALVAALGVAVALRPYVVDRILAFRDPWARAGDEGFQLVQSFVAFARGGLLGVGLGDGRQKLYYLPEAHTDFVLSVLAEELGLVGVAFVIGAFAALLVAGCRIALRARDRFQFLLAAGMTAYLTVPAVLNAAVVMGMVPPKGIAMPFLSYGRTSLLVSCIAVGTLIGVARQIGAQREPATSGDAWRSWKP
ncbi:MAG: stage V sporulation protein E [Proteobacteria bacterium]|nr:MAG: stage V sporulation protein E [Pseudomonadota bacterium]